MRPIKELVREHKAVQAAIDKENLDSIESLTEPEIPEQSAPDVVEGDPQDPQETDMLDEVPDHAVDVVSTPEITEPEHSSEADTPEGEHDESREIESVILPEIEEPSLSPSEASDSPEVEETTETGETESADDDAPDGSPPAFNQNIPVHNDRLQWEEPEEQSIPVPVDTPAGGFQVDSTDIEEEQKDESHEKMKDEQAVEKMEYQMTANEDLAEQLTEQLGPMFDQMRDHQSQTVMDYFQNQQLITSFMRL